MSTLPNTKVIVGNGNLGRTAPSEDGTSLMFVSGAAVSGQFALGDLLGPFYSADDADAVRINAAYDTANSCMASKHISDFYQEAGEGVKLYVVVLAKTVTLAQMADVEDNYAAAILPQLEGDIKLVIFSRVPPSEDEPSFAGELETDVVGAMFNAQALVDYEQTKGRRISVFIEGRNWQGSVSDILNLRDSEDGPNANRVSLIIGNDWNYSSSLAYRNTYASVGLFAGRVAGGPVNRNAGRVKTGKLKITVPGLSNGAKVSTLSDAHKEALNVKGYIYIKKVGKNAGYFFNDDHCACVITDDYAFVNHGRTIDKAARICEEVFDKEINDEVQVEVATGKLPLSVIKNYQGMVETEIGTQMTGEISGVSAFCDANQNVLTTDKIITRVSVIKTGTSRYLEVPLGFTNPFLNN